MDYDPFISASATGLVASPIREMAKLLGNPEIVSLAGGVPDPNTFPIDKLPELIGKAAARKGGGLLQYGVTKGNVELRELLSSRMALHGTRFPVDDLMITSGAQQGLQLLADVILDPGDAVLVERPAYVGALGCFRARRAALYGVDQDHEGLIPEKIALAARNARDSGHRPKILYLVPSFQNPTGSTLPRARRKEILAAAIRENLIIIEDDPYRDLGFGDPGSQPETLAAQDEEGRVAYLGSFSKIFAPGLRVGWLGARGELSRKLELAKQAADLCTETLGPELILEFFRSGDGERHVESLRAHYRHRRDAIHEALETEFGNVRGATWNRPEGGFFLWVEVHSEINATEALSRAIKEGVAYIPGSAFFVDQAKHNSLRLSYSGNEPAALSEGVQRLARTLENL